MDLRKFKKTDEEDGNIFWVTMTDLLLGLTMVFMILFILMMTGYSQNKFKQQATQSEVAQKLSSSLKKQKINASIDKITGQVKISDLELFEINSFTLSNKGKQYLDKFIPIYVETIFSNPKLSNKITSVVIQGHTDSQTYSGINSREGQFIKNMDLSLKRANAVAEYIFKTNYDKKYTDKLTKTIAVEGKSFTEPIFINGKEDYDKSRRVELKLIVKDPSLEDFLIKNNR